MSRALCVFVCVCRAAASFQLREGHLPVSAQLRLYHAAAVRVCQSGLLLDAIPGQFLTVDLE